MHFPVDQEIVACIGPPQHSVDLNEKKHLVDVEKTLFDQSVSESQTKQNRDPLPQDTQIREGAQNVRVL